VNVINFTRVPWIHTIWCREKFQFLCLREFIATWMEERRKNRCCLCPCARVNPPCCGT